MINFYMHLITMVFAVCLLKIAEKEKRRFFRQLLEKYKK